MPELVVNGCTISYQEFGTGSVPVVLTPGGRWGGYVISVIATELAKKIAASSPGTGATPTRAPTSSSPATNRGRYLGRRSRGADRGAEVSPLVCRRICRLPHHPAAGRQISEAGERPAAALAVGRRLSRQSIAEEFLPAIHACGVARRYGRRDETSHFAELIKQNPGNRERLLAMKPIDFVRQMAYWESFFITSSDLPIAGCRLTIRNGPRSTSPRPSPAASIRRIRPKLRNASRASSRALTITSPLGTVTQWDANFGASIPYPTTANFQGDLIAPVWRDFIRQIEK